MMSLVSPPLHLIQPLCPRQREEPFGLCARIGKKLQYHQHSLHVVLFSPELSSAELPPEKHAPLNIRGHWDSASPWPRSRHITSLMAQRQCIHPQHHLQGVLMVQGE